MADIDDLLAAVAAGPQGPEVGAFFDFDGTLINGYSAALYFRQRLTSGAMGAAGAPRHPRRGLQHAAARARRHAAGRGRPRRPARHRPERPRGDGSAALPVADLGQLYPDARRLVRAHLRAGHTVALASSATRFQAQAAAEDLGIEHLLVTEVETLDGILTGRVDGPILWGPGKAAAVEAFADEQRAGPRRVLRLRQRRRGRPLPGDRRAPPPAQRGQHADRRRRPSAGGRCTGCTGSAA